MILQWARDHFWSPVFWVIFWLILCNVQNRKCALLSKPRTEQDILWVKSSGLSIGLSYCLHPECNAITLITSIILCCPSSIASERSKMIQQGARKECQSRVFWVVYCPSIIVHPELQMRSLKWYSKERDKNVVVESSGRVYCRMVCSALSIFMPQKAHYSSLDGGFRQLSGRHVSFHPSSLWWWCLRGTTTAWRSVRHTFYDVVHTVEINDVSDDPSATLFYDVHSWNQWRKRRSVWHTILWRAQLKSMTSPCFRHFVTSTPSIWWCGTHNSLTFTHNTPTCEST